QTYYWRVDEVNGTPDKTVFKGDVWSFTVEPYSIQIPGAEIMVTASSSTSDFSLPEKLVDGSGLGADGSHDIIPETMWFTATGDLDPSIQFEFDDIKQLDTMTVWNSNGAAESAIGWGVKEVVVEYSQDGENWTVLEGVTQFSRAPGLVTYATPDEIAFGGVPAKMVRLDIGSNWGGILMSYGLSEVQFSMIPAQARTPEPASGSTGVAPDAVVTWRSGREAGEHRIYIGTDADAVADGTAPSVTTATNSLALDSLDAQLGETYYWRVDEVNDAEETTVWAGPVWNLGVIGALVVEDFEAYGNLSPDRPFQTWLDGFGYSADEFFPVEYPGNGTGAGIGHDIWTLTSPHYDGDIMETRGTIFGSTQAMPFYFDGASQTDRQFAPAQDWTLAGITTLSIAVRGSLDLTAANTLYAKINGQKVTYDGDLSIPAYRPWHIDLTTLGDVSNVTTMTLGVEGTGSGMVLIDDILLHKTAPVIPGPPAGGDTSMVGHWKLDETEGLIAADSSGNENHGTLVGMDGTEWIAGIMGGALMLDGSGQYVDFGNDTSLQLTEELTIATWVKMEPGNADAYMGIAGKLAGNNGYALVRHGSNV
ncbi:MAG: discoidin domain-containing protein, partial [Planctomycetes bacterium]|nr:discoidin domain-containing protein [Planctomycetota bacterium]